MERVKLSVGREIDQLADIGAALHHVRQQQFDYLLVPIVQRDARPGDRPRHPAKPVSSAEMRSAIYGLVSTWIDPDSDDPELRRESEHCLRREIEWWAHLGMPAAVLPMPLSDACCNYARVVNQLAARLRTMKLLLRVPLQAEDDDRSWHVWNRFRNLCGQSPAVGLAIEIAGSLPGDAGLRRWYGEPLFMAILPTALFARDGQAHPVIPESHRPLVNQLFLRQVTLFLSGPDVHRAARGERAYAESLHDLHRALPPVTPQEAFEAQFYDRLQPPLQPLRDDLEAATYDVFEQDPVKYRKYEEAIYRALLERHGPDERVVVMVVGAGRGPLVGYALRAAERARRRIFVYAVEKNPNAVVTLKGAHASQNWQGRVEIVAGDMRSWSPQEPADILVSELLGSFGDNELSPECLDGAQRYLKPGTGISIPCRSLSYLAPISSQRLHNRVAALKEDKWFETGFVVRMHNFCQLDVAKPCFRFMHPNDGSDPVERDNRRYASLSFTASANAMIHGFVGYFEAVLYEDIALSILPETFSEGMAAWFPIYWPLRQPVQVEKGQCIDVQFWRQTDPRYVWYEWALSAPQCLPIHNPNGRSYRIGL